VKTAVVVAILAAWIIGIVLAVVDGITVLRITTPLMSTLLGFELTGAITR
jgi:hypothetical protein